MSVEEDKKIMRKLSKEVREGKRQKDAEAIKEIAKLRTEYEVTIKVVSQEGWCAARHKVGHEWVMKGAADSFIIPPGICMFAYYTMHPCISTLMFGGSFSWDPEPDITHVPCPDSRNPVVFELKRTEPR